MIYLIELFKFGEDGVKSPYLIKVGYSHNPQKRLRQIQRFKGECYLRLTVPGTVDREQVILSRLRVRHKQPGNRTSEYFHHSALEDALIELNKFKKGTT